MQPLLPFRIELGKVHIYAEPFLVPFPNTEAPNHHIYNLKTVKQSKYGRDTSPCPRHN